MKTADATKATLNWEFIWGRINHPVAHLGEDENYGILRAKVPGGWLIATTQGGPEKVAGPKHYIPRGLCFYPDPCHAWDVTVEM